MMRKRALALAIPLLLAAALCIIWAAPAGAASCAPGPGADLIGCNFADANLSNADLSGANLATADLSGANLTSANLSGAVFS